MVTKVCHFPKTDSCNENACFFTFQIQIVFAYFSKHALFAQTKKPTFLFTTTPNTFFVFLFHFFIFSCFFSLSLFYQHKKDKNRKCIFFVRKPFFDSLTNNRNKIFAPLHTICDFKAPPKHYKTGEKQANNNLGPSFDQTLDQVLTQQTNLGPSFDSTTYVYIYIYIYMLYGQ